MNAPSSSLVDAIAKRRSVIVMGSGVSAQSKNSQGMRPPTWRGFLDKALGELEESKRRGIKKLLNRGDYLTSCDVIQRRLGKDEFKNLLKREFLDPKFEASELHKLIFELDSKLVITPNFDKIYDSYVSAEAHGTVVLKTHTDSDVIEGVRRGDRMILKMHGTIDSPAKLIFTRSDYTQARTKHRDFYSLIESLGLTHTFLFIGCGVSDPDISLVFEDMFSKYPDSPCHVMSIPKNEIKGVEEEIFTELTNIKLIKYDPKDGHKAVVDWVRDLKFKVQEKREELAQRLDW
ncbi:hypothetical protein Rhal01_01933 [Rubritalea halochordaticola]|uniref:SIR2-like domain-containing protein n=1 Tax=Rubritalea halochordaticola TaxID=714537 RepID=A0ABP9V2E5_9BACT